MLPFCPISDKKRNSPLFTAAIASFLFCWCWHKSNCRLSNCHSSNHFEKKIKFFSRNRDWQCYPNLNSQLANYMASNETATSPVPGGQGGPLPPPPGAGPHHYYEGGHGQPPPSYQGSYPSQYPSQIPPGAVGRVSPSFQHHANAPVRFFLWQILIIVRTLACTISHLKFAYCLKTNSKKLITPKFIMSNLAK